jgi:hypothetical protein
LASSKEAIAGHVSVKVSILPSAFNDLVEGRVFYDSQGEYLGDYFFNTLFSELDSLALYAGIHPVFQGFHKFLSETFPYAIYYKIIDEVAVVFRVLDCRIDPIKTRRRLKKC